MSERAERLAAVDKLLNAKSIAVIGASDRPDYGGRLLSNLRKSGYAGRLYPVNTRREVVQGLKSYHDVRDIPDAPDMAVLAIPAAAVAATLDGCGQAGIRSAAIISAGFAERGGEGMRMQEELSEVAHRHGIFYTGPNSLGIANIHTGMISHASREWDCGGLQAGGLSIISQSGALGFGPIFHRAAEGGIGLNKIITVGNQASLSVLDLLEFLIERDETTRAIGIYLESLPAGSGQRLVAIGRAAARRGKGIVVMKVGRSPEGRLATAAHTGALGGDDKAYDAAFRQGGIIRADDIDQIWLTADLLAAYPRMILRQGAAVMTNSGGLNSHVVDLCSLEGIPVAPLAEATVEQIATRLAGRGAAGNPADLSGQVMRSEESGEVRGNPAIADYVRYMTQDAAVDVTMLGITAPSSGVGSVEAAQMILDEWHGTKPPLVVIWAAGSVLDGFPSPDNAGYKRLRAGGLPVFEDATLCVKAIAAMRRRAAWANALPAEASSTGGGAATAPVAWQRRGRAAEELALIERLGVPIVATTVADTATAAVEIAIGYGLPVMMKLFSPDLVHKSDVGAVRGPLRDADAVAAAWEELRALGDRLGAADPVVGVQEFAGRDTVEMLLSCYRDEVFGTVTLLGLGGIWVEALQDVAAGVGPLSTADVRAMVASLKGAAVLTGLRGKLPRDIDSLCAAAAALSRAFEHPGLAEIQLIELNPVMVLPAGQGLKAVDARLTLGHQDGAAHG